MPCHRERGGAELSNRKLAADTGCTTTLLTPDYSRFVVGKAASGSNKAERVLLGGKDHVLHVQPKQRVEIPVVDVDGHVRLMAEDALYPKTRGFHCLRVPRRVLSRVFQAIVRWCRLQGRGVTCFGFPFRWMESCRWSLCMRVYPWQG